ncbi:MAG: Acyl-CoA dehydrogenase [Syntrophus sp. PtaU1.Bin005]|uniref:acyl-CoA dehydrogenase family protein n=1 Tax=Syntrophus sp. (in: bacteria) TaxID=48412 RepID=UPI0009D32FA5|nr:MAG: Acyl-CoA dehydrogenase [Syntrophus sp. PtaU1.Bin005]
MDFELDQDLLALKESVQKLVQEKVAPRAGELDEIGGYPWDIKEAFAENRILAIPFPSEYGGTGGKALPMAIAVEEISKFSCSVAMMLSGQCLGSAAITIAGTEEQKQQFLPDLARGKTLAAYGLTEPDAGSDVASLQTTAVRDGDDYVVTGSKRFITYGDIADVMTLFVKTVDPATKEKKVSCLVAEKGPGWIVSKLEHKIGIKGSTTTELFLEDFRVPVKNLLGKEGDGFKIAMQVLDKTRTSIAAQAVGMAQGALDCAVQFAREHLQSGKPIGRKQGIQMKLADMEMKTEAARYLTYMAADKYDRHDPNQSRYSSCAKAYASDLAMEVIGAAIQVLGEYGYTKKYPVERMFRDAKVQQIYEGTNEIQRIVIARSLLGKGF